MDIDILLDDFKEKLGMHLRNIRITKNYLPNELVDPSRLYRTKINTIENGRSNMEFTTVIKLAIGLEIDLCTFFNYKNEGPFKFRKQSKSFDERFLWEKQQFSARLFQIMKLRDINQPRLSVLADISEGDITLIKQADKNFRLLQLVKLADALKINVASLFDYSGPLP